MFVTIVYSEEDTTPQPPPLPPKKKKNYKEIQKFFFNETELKKNLSLNIFPLE